jgi:DNA repair protein RecO (recombination protein O)
MLIRDEAICIRAVDYSETSQIVTFFTRENGKVGAIAKGSKRPKSAFDGAIELFSHGSIVFFDANREKLATLTEFEQSPAFTNLCADLFAFNCCLLATELVEKMTEDYDRHPQLFDSFLQLLENVNETRDALKLLILFELSLLKEVGLGPVVSACANCKTRRGEQEAMDEVYFSSSANGLICRDCEGSFQDKVKMTASAANCLSNLKMLFDADEKTLGQVEKILIYHFTELLHRPPRMARYILKG